MSAEGSSLLEELADSSLQGRAFRAECMVALSRLPGYNWCGIYRMDGPDELVLDEYVGAKTDHMRIAVGVGVCGTAVATGENQVISDVRELDNYLACSLETRSEVVVLIRRGNDLLGQIDIDGHEVGRFGPADEHMLEAVAALIAERWED